MPIQQVLQIEFRDARASCTYVCGLSYPLAAWIDAQPGNMVDRRLQGAAPAMGLGQRGAFTAASPCLKIATRRL